MTEFKYVGAELDLFAAAIHWKSYWSQQMAPFVSGDVLEVGAGIGSNTPFIDHGNTGQWLCIEPDPGLVAQLSSKAGRPSGRQFEAVCGTIQTVPRTPSFDTIVYIDVLEHIEDDRLELELAAACLRPNGRLIVLSPAHQALFTPFDVALGHFRRYSFSTLRKISPPGLRIERMRYLDCAGLTASIANLLILRQSLPTARQVRLWDRWMVPVSKVLDPAFGYGVGKSILAVWKKS